MFTLAFWKATAERAISTFAQTFIALSIVTNPMELQFLNYGDITIVSGISAGLAVIKALAAAAATNGSPSLVDAEVLSKPAPVEKNESLAG